MPATNLGQVSAIFKGTSAPTNTNLVWQDTSVSPHVFKSYDSTTSSWRDVGSFTLSSRNLTINGTTNQVTVSGGTQNLGADRTWTISLPSSITGISSLDFSGTLSIGSTLATTLNLGTSSSNTTINIGTSGTNVITIGNSNSTVNIQGTVNTVSATNLNVVDKLFTVNKGGTTSSGSGSGFEIEENSSITGYIKTTGGRDGFLFKAPANTADSSFIFTSSSARSFTFPDASGTIALTSDITGGFSVTNESNNRVITSSGAGTGNAEANLTFDGTTLNTTGDVVITGDLDASEINISGSSISVNSGGNKAIGLLPSGNGDVQLFTTTTGTGILIPGTDNLNDIGKTSPSNTRWRNIYISGAFHSEKTSNQLVFGDGVQQTIINAPTVTSSITLTIPDALGAANFALTDVGVANRIPYWTSTSKLTNISGFAYDGNTLTMNTTQPVLSLIATAGAAALQMTSASDSINNIFAGITLDTGTNPALTTRVSRGGATINTRPLFRFINEATNVYEIAANGTWDYRGNALTGISQATITNTGATAGLTVTKSGSGNGITVTNSGSGLAGQFENIGLKGNTISSTNTNGNILLTPNGTGYTDITAGGLRIAGTERISNAGIATFASAIITGQRTYGANSRTLELNKTVTLTDATATTIFTLTLPTGSNLGGIYTAQITGTISNQLNLTGGGTSLGGQRIDATVTFGQDSGAVSSEGVKTTILLGTLAGDALTSRTIVSATISVAISGTNNSVHEIQLTVTGGGSTTPPVLHFIGDIKVHRSFSSLTLA